MEAAFLEHELSINKVLTSLVKCHHDTNYTKIKEIFVEYVDDLKLSNVKIVDEITLILKEGKLSTKNLSKNFERFLLTLTYQLFSTEVRRYPAALIHNVIVLL